MDFRRLKYFVTVAEELNIGRAAQRLHISQPPLTRQIHLLEEDMGVELFVRSSRGVELTQAGELFLEDARNIQTILAQAHEKAQKAAAGKLGRLDIGIFGTGIFSSIPKILRIFSESHPEVRLVLHNMNKDEQVDALLQKRIALGFNRFMKPHPEIVSRFIIREQMLLAVPDNHPLSQHSAVSFMELANYPLVLFPSGGRPNFVDRLLGLCAKRDFTPEILQIVDDPVLGMAHVAGGMGITLVPQSVSALKAPGVVYIPFNDEPSAHADLSCMFRRGDPSSVLKEFLASIQTFRQRESARQEIVPPEQGAAP